MGKIVRNNLINKNKYNLKSTHGYYTRFTPDNKLAPGGRMIYNDKLVIVHKCEGCGETDNHNWDNGNNYKELWKQRKFFNLFTE